MNIGAFEQILVDPKDLECGVCYLRYTPKTNEPLIMICCGHQLCSFCFEKIKDLRSVENTKVFCPFCRAEISENAIRNKLLSSFLERDSHMKKCETHKQPIVSYCKENNKLVCSQCEVKENPNKFGSIQEIYAKMEEKKKAVEKIQEDNKKTLKNLHGKISKGNQNLKRQFDDICEERLAQDLAKQKKLKSSLNVILFTEKEQCEHQLLAQGLSNYEENYKKLENWKNSQEENIVTKIFDTNFTTEQAVQFYSDKAKQISKSITAKEKSLEKILYEAKNNSHNFFEKLSEKFHAETKLDPKYHQEIAREYLLDTFEEHGIVANYQEKEDCFELSKSFSISKLKKFHPDLFECSIEKLSFSCASISSVKFKILCELLQNTQELSNLTLSLKEPSSRQIELLSSLILQLKALKNFSFRLPLFHRLKKALKGYIQSLLNSERVSGFSLEFTFDDSNALDFQQDLVLFPAQTKKPIEELSLKFLGTVPLYEQVFQIISGALKETVSLQKVKVSFGDQTNYALFLQELRPILRKSRHNLQELDLGFANVNLLNSGLGQQISQVIINSKELRKVSLFLAGNELSNKVFDDLFYLEGPKVFVGHKLEELSLTIMQCGDVDISKILRFLCSFPKLKKLILRINRVDIILNPLTALNSKYGIIRNLP